MRTFILFPALLLVCVMTNGCFIGLAVAHPRDKFTTQYCLGSRGTFTNTSPLTPPMSEDKLLAAWGQPDSKLTNDENLIVWHYQGEYNWTFITPAYILPLPIPIPSGHGFADFYFTNGIAQKAHVRVPVATGFLFGPCGLVAAWEKEFSWDESSIVGYGFKENYTPQASLKPPDSQSP